MSISPRSRGAVNTQFPSPAARDRPSAARRSLYGSMALYAVCTGLNRGAVLLALPFLASSLSLADFGLFGLAQTLVQLLPPVLSLNGAAAVEREAATDPLLGNRLVARYARITLLLGGAASLAAWAVAPATLGWLAVVILLGTAESLHLLVLTWLRAVGKPGLYALLSLGKTVGMLALMARASLAKWTLLPLLDAQLWWYLAIAALATVPMLLRRGAWGIAPMAAALAYTLPLIPHSAAQWVLSSSDRLVIKLMLGDEPLGLYSIAYALASAVLLLNSGVALSLPPHFFRNYERWLSPLARWRFFVAYTAVVVVTFVALLGAVELDRRYTGRLGTYPPVMIQACAWIVAGVYLLGLYLFFTNYLFYHRKSGRIALITAITAVVSLSATAGLIPIFGVLGPAISTFISYALYLTLVVREARRQDPRVTPLSGREWSLLTGSAAGLVLIGYGWSAAW